MKRKTMKKKSYLFDSTLVTALFAAVLTMGACAENDLENRNSEGDKGAAVSFEVKDVQEAVLADSMPGSRAGDAATFNHQLNELGLTQADLEMQVLEAQAPEGMEACLVESTLPGINPVLPDPQTRATVTKTLTADFSTLGYRATSQTAVSSTPDWFYNARTKSNGELYNTLYWSWSGNHFGRFYGVYPEVKDTYSKIKLSPATHVGNPYVEFEVEPNVVDQKDLMTACSGVVEYQTRGVAPNTSLAFRHALTAVHFTVGQNLWAGRITKIEISGAINKGTYTLSSNPTQPGTWTLGTTTGTFTLSGININTAASPGSVITDDNGNYTFFMIPQQVTGKNIYVDIHFQDGKIIHVPLKGKWLPGTTKTYTLSNKQSNWDYQLEVLDKLEPGSYLGGDAGLYTIRSYRQVNGIQVPVAWKVSGYDANNDGIFTMNEKPDWMELSHTESNGHVYPLSYRAMVKAAVLVDRLPQHQATLKKNPKGTAGNYYDLSTHNIKGVSTQRNTANCYIISHPGFYKIPLVYGNAIKNGSNNPNAYKTSNSGGQILTNFKDHNDQNITDPWIEKTNNGANSGIDGAEIVWADEANLVHLAANPIVRSGNETYLQFEVKATDIKMGNAVVAVTKNNIVVWSWHLWFTTENVLQTTACTNYQNVVYKFAEENIGWKYTEWITTSYDTSRKVKVKLQQAVKNGTYYKEAVFTVTQLAYKKRRGYCTLYQFGRKDALPGFKILAQGNFSSDNVDPLGRSLGYAIQNPGKMLHSTIQRFSNWDWCNQAYYNLWSANNSTTGYNDNPVVKTIYDPCPTGFKMPAGNAFTGFSKTGENTENLANANANGKWIWGWDFNNKIVNPNTTIWFPVTSYREPFRNTLTSLDFGKYWTAIPLRIGDGCGMGFEERRIDVKMNQIPYRSLGYAVRSVSE